MTTEWSDDDALLRDLGAALADAADTPASFTGTARELYAWRTFDAELAELTFDSELADAGEPVRGSGEVARSMTFESTGWIVEIDVEREPDVIRGQVTGPQVAPPPELTVESVDGGRAATLVDPTGYFALDPNPLAGKRFRLRFGGIVTPWID